MITITHAVLSCCEWTKEHGCGKHLWETTGQDTGIDMDMANAKLKNLLRSVASDLDYADNLGGKPAADLWPTIRETGGWHNEVDEDEPHRWCSAWSLPIDGKCYCVDLWLAGPGCTGKKSEGRIILDAQDKQSAFLKWPDGYDKMVLRTVENPGCPPLTDKEVQEVFNIIDAAFANLPKKGKS